jgi:hypothetical protein
MKLLDQYISFQILLLKPPASKQFGGFQFSLIIDNSRNILLLSEVEIALGLDMDQLQSNYTTYNDGKVEYSIPSANCY